MAAVVPLQAVLFRPGAPELAQWTSIALEPLSRWNTKGPAYKLYAGTAAKTCPETSAAAVAASTHGTGAPGESTCDVGVDDDLLFLDETLGFFVYRQEFRTDSGLDKSRLGLVALLDPDGDPSGPVYTTQDTEPYGVERCAEEISESTLQLTPLIAAVEDLKFELEKLLERGILLRDQPDISIELPQGDRHRLWKIEDPTLLGKLTEFFRGKECFLLDGIHSYRALRRLFPEDPLCPLTIFFNLFDFGVSLSASTLLVKDLPGLKINDVALRMEDFFETKTYPFAGPQQLPRALTDFREDLRIRGFTENVVGACFAGVDHFFLFQLREGVDRAKVFLPDVKPPHQEFDSVLLRSVLLEQYLGVSAAAGAVDYTWSIEEAVAAVRSGKFGAAFFINPPNKRKLLNLARSGFRLPPGSARLEPPVRSRLVMTAAGRAR